MKLRWSMKGNVRTAIVVFAAFVVLVIWAGVWSELRSQYADMTRRGYDQSEFLARILSEQAERTIFALDQSLIALKSEFEQNPGRFSIKASPVSALVARQVPARLIHLAQDGRLRDGSDEKFSLADADIFRQTRDFSGTGLLITLPAQDPGTGQWSVYLLRRLVLADGTFAGMIGLATNPDWLLGGASALASGAEEWLAVLAGRDGFVRVSAGPQSDSLMVSFARQPLRDVLPDDGSRLVSTVPLAVYPLSVSVSRDFSSVLAPYYVLRGKLLVQGLAGSVLVVLACGALLILLRQQSRVNEDLSRKKAELQGNQAILRSYASDLERIADVAAHDLQEPLRRVVAYAQLLASHVETALDEQGRGYMAHVVDSAIQMRKLVKDLESFVAVDHMPLPGREIEASLAVDQAVSRLGDDLRQADVVLVVDTLPAVAAGLHSLTEIFCQLLDNAVRYRNPQRQTIVQISARRDGGMVLFSVRDNGRGIEQSNLRRVFELFNRLNGFDKPGHTGIGLAIVRRVVERLGGQIWVESSVGEGTTFRFTLPQRVSGGVSVPAEVRAAAA